MICVHMVVITTTTITDSRYKAAQAYGAAKVAQIRGMDRGCLLSPDSSIRGNSTMPHCFGKASLPATWGVSFT